MTAAKRKAAERARHKEAGRVAVTHYVYHEDREKVARYIKRLNERWGAKHNAGGKPQSEAKSD